MFALASAPLPKVAFAAKMARALTGAAVGVGLFGSLWTQAGWAEEPPTPVQSTPTAQAPSPIAQDPDVVLLADGTRYRGTILEAVAGDHVLIRIAKDTLREAPMEEVVYAGPAQGAPAMQPQRGVRAATSATGAANAASAATYSAAPSEERPLGPGEVWVHFETGTPSLTVWLSPMDRPDRGGLSRLCEAPCKRAVPEGKYRVAFSVGDRKPREAASALNLRHEAWLRADLESRRGARVLGFVTLGIGALVGTLVISSAIPLWQYTDKDRAMNRTLIGAGLLGGGLAIGLPLGLMGDTAVVVALPRPNQTRDFIQSGSDEFRGLALRGSF